MATAVEFQAVNVQRNEADDGNVWSFLFAFVGSDIPTGSQVQSVTVLILDTDTLAQAETKIAAAVRDFAATSYGTTIPANRVVQNTRVPT